MPDINIRHFDLPTLDLSYSANLASGAQVQVEESARALQKRMENQELGRQQVVEALKQTAYNTGETVEQLHEVIENQNEYIKILKEKNQTQEEQLSILKNLFSSTEDSVIVEKEIMKLIRNQIDSSHPLWEFVKDKGGDIAVAGIINGMPIFFNAFRQYLLLNGISI